MTDPHVVVFGDVIDDIIVTPAGPIRPDTDTSARIEQHAGGSAANAAAWFGHLGCRVDFSGHVHSADVARHADLLRRHGVTPHLTGSDLPTGSIVVILQPDRTRSMLTSRGANASTSPRDVDRSLLAPGRHLHFTGYSIFAAPTPDADGDFAALLHDARAAGTSISVNPGSAGFIDEHGAARVQTVLAGADIVLPNLDEGRALTGARSPDDVVEALLEHHRVVALTLGRQGAIAAARGAGCVRLDALPVTPVDTTGAGDAFGAGFVDALLRSGALSHQDVGSAALEAALRAGVACAAVAVARTGGRPPATGIAPPPPGDGGGPDA